MEIREGKKEIATELCLYCSKMDTNGVCELEAPCEAAMRTTDTILSYLFTSTQLKAIDEGGDIAVLDPDQSLPDNPHNMTRKCADEDGVIQTYRNLQHDLHEVAQKDMVKAHWRKTITEEAQDG